MSANGYIIPYLYRKCKHYLRIFYENFVKCVSNLLCNETLTIIYHVSQSFAASKKSRHSEPVNDFTGVGIRILYAL